MRIFKKSEEVVAGFYKRTDAREKTIMLSTMNLVAYFMGLGDDQETSEGKVSQVSLDISSLLYIYTLGNIQPLVDAVNAIDEVAMPFMDTAAKAYLVGQLTPPV